jgi:hypothetical protein
MASSEQIAIGKPKNPFVYGHLLIKAFEDGKYMNELHSIFKLETYTSKKNEIDIEKSNPFWRARKYCHRTNGNNIPRETNDYIGHVKYVIFGKDMKSCQKKTLLLLKLLGIDKNDLSGKSNIIPREMYIPYVCGSPDSTDTDVICIITDPDYPFDFQVDKICLIDLINEMTKHGFDLGEEGELLDISVVQLNARSDVKKSAKGTTQVTQNIAFFTWHHHRQIHEMPLPIKRCIPVSEISKSDILKGLIKCFMDNIKFFRSSDDYRLDSKRKGVEYGGTLKEKMNFVMSFVSSDLVLFPDQFNDLKEFTDLEDPEIEKRYINKVKKWQDCMKSLMMKIIQMILLMCDQLEYNKLELPARYTECCKNYHGVKDWEHEIRWFLTRGKSLISSTGEMTTDIDRCKACLYHLLGQCSIIVDDVQIKTNWIQLEMSNFNNPSHFTDGFWSEYLNSQECTIEKVDQIILSLRKTFPEKELCDFTLGDIMTFFYEESKNIDVLRIIDPVFVQNHVYECAQRSPEWMHLLKFHMCGNNTGLPQMDIIDGETDKEHLQRIIIFYWNLIQGNLAEEIVSNMVNLDIVDGVDLSGYAQVHVGMIVEEKDSKDSLGNAPDMLLVHPTTGDVIPVEIKGVVGEFSENNSLRRVLDTALKQLSRCRNIMLKYGDILSKSMDSGQGIGRGIIIVINYKHHITSHATFVYFKT